MECIAKRYELEEIAGENPQARLAVVSCEDERHKDDPVYWVFLIDEDDDAGRVADDYWSHVDTCLDIAVEITTTADFLAGKEGETQRFSIPLGDRLRDCESCGKEYAVWAPGVDPCPFCGVVPVEE
jgi:hypothetical protein